jgi:hypothetical protein
MKKIFVTVFAACMVLVGGAQSVLAQDVNATPVEFRMCHFVEGKGYEDLGKVAAKFRDYANKSDLGYAAWILSPEFSTDIGWQVAWLGAWPDGETYGVSMEKWRSPENQLMSEFREVIQCPGHIMMASLPINAPSGTPEDGIVLSYPCTLNEGKNLKQAYKAHLDYGQTMKANGSLSISWMYTPMAGFGASEIDYYHVVAFYRYSDLGSTMDLFVNRGGVETRQKIIDPIASCQTPNVYNAESVRAHDER